MRILLAEDDPAVASFVRRGLREEQYAVDVARDGEQALIRAQTDPYDLMLLDLVLPKRTGLEVLRTLRANRISTPVLVLTAKGQPEDRVTGLNLGADDYLPKPFRFEELLARIRALLRRRGGLTSTVLRAADLEVDLLRRRVLRGGRELWLTGREFAVLEYLLRHPNQVVTRTMLAEHVWEHDFDTFSNVINVHIARLRRKIDDGFPRKLLQTVRGTGYTIQAEDDDA
ncbi:MAG: response regulator transcription factor [Candidatus Omnitrophica bacterium]|nr:response regulator transcription factor [Candidatus Omnitrophota bacterium]